VNGNSISFLHPQFLQSGGKAQGQIEQPGIGHGGIHEGIAERLDHVAIDQGRFVGVLADRVQEKLVQRRIGIVNRRRYAGIVLVQPWLLHVTLPFY
jgi:hypothetical protein